MALNGRELINVTPILPTGRPAGEEIQTTTQDIANLGGGSGASIVGFGNDTSTTTGLVYGILAGAINFDANSDQNDYVAGTVTLFDDTVNTLYLCPDLSGSIELAVVVVDANLSQPFLPVSNFILAVVTTENGEITNISDRRCVATTGYLSRQGLVDLSYVKTEDNGDDTFSVHFKSGYLLRPDGTTTPVSGPYAKLVDPDAVNYFEVNSSGVVSTNTSGFTAGRLALFTVELLGGVPQSVTDYRSFLYIPTGASGSFTSNDSKTITVVNGVITDIS